MNHGCFVRAMLLALLVMVCAPALTGCASRPSERSAEYVFVTLVTGPTVVEGERRTEMFRGHMSNIQRLAAEGSLLIAGPYKNPEDRTQRGIFVMNVATVEDARALVATDPAVAAGVFDVRLRPMVAPVALRRAPALEAEMLAKGEITSIAGEPPRTMRAYVIIDEGSHERVGRAVREAGLAVVWSGRFADGTGVYVVDATTAAEVRAKLPTSATGPCAIDGWFGTISLEGMIEGGAAAGATGGGAK